MSPVLEQVSADHEADEQALARQPVTASGDPEPDSRGDPIWRRKVAEALAAADELRDRRAWREAALAYRAVLDLDWELAPIWVQYGHALKESRDFAGALAAYEQALELAPNVADTYLQLGHLLKIMRRTAAAIDAYRGALELDPRLHNAARELTALGVQIPDEFHAGSGIGAERFYYDISDLIDHFQRARSPTGIQRIVMSVTGAALTGSKRERVRACVVDPMGNGWKLVDTGKLLQILRLSCASADTSAPEWRGCVAELLRQVAEAPALRFPKNAIIITLGSPWGITGFIHAVDAAKRASSVAWVAFVHDTVPLSFPEYCDRNMPATYLRWISTLLSLADRVLTNSESTKADLLRFVPALAPRCAVVRPDGDFRTVLKSGDEPRADVREVVRAGKYALFVGTIEPRKNHLLAAAAWRRLLLELGAREIPNLVFVGRLGWNWESIVAFAERTGNLDGKLMILTEVADSDLGFLYQHALFTLHCSHYEGWGLPVSESLSFGKIPVIPRHSGLMESGGDHAVYFEPNSEPALVRAIRELLADSDGISTREQRMRSSAVVRSWHAISDEIVEGAEALVIVPPPRRDFIIGKMYRFGLQAFGARSGARQAISGEPIEDFAATEALKTGMGWHAPEEWGVRTAQDHFEFQLDLPINLNAAQAEPGLCLYLALRGHEEQAELRFVVNDTGLPPLQFARMERRVVRLPVSLRSGAERGVNVTCYQTGVYADRNDRKEQPRMIGVGVEFMMLCRVDDVAARLSIVEEVAGVALIGI